MAAENSARPILELRVALTAQDYDRLVRFYCDGLGLAPAHLWTTNESRALILEMGQATLEIFDEAHARVIDTIETGQRTSGVVRFALHVPDLQVALDRALAYGATMMHPPVVTPWGHYNVRVQDPDGMQITLFQVLEQQ